MRHIRIKWTVRWAAGAAGGEQMRHIRINWRRRQISRESTTGLKYRPHEDSKCDTYASSGRSGGLLVRLYAQVWMENRCLAMRSAPMHILVYAPKDDTVWGVGHQAPDQVLLAFMQAFPGKMQMLHLDGFSYNDWDQS